jgi:hypothetical protein
MSGPPLLVFLEGASVVRRDAFFEAGGFEPRFFIGGEVARSGLSIFVSDPFAVDEPDK